MTRFVLVIATLRFNGPELISFGLGELLEAIQKLSSELGARGNRQVESFLGDLFESHAHAANSSSRGERSRLLLMPFYLSTPWSASMSSIP